MGKRKRKLSKAVISVIVTAVTATVLLAAVLITNLFIPVKYFTAYCVKGSKNQNGTMRVNFIDVDFGDCILIELPDGKNVLIDGGDGAYQNTLNILRYLNSRKVDTVDYLICTSVKNEHCGGLAEIVNHKKVSYAYVPYSLNTRITDSYHSFITALEKRGVEYGYASVGSGIYDSDNGYFITFLSPVNFLSPKSEYVAMNSKPTAGNIENASVVAWLEYRDTAFALTSDVRVDGLKRIVEDYKLCKEVNQPFCPIGNFEVKLEKCKIVTAPGHAGKDNTYAPWYDLTKPEQTVVSVGKNFAGYPTLTALSDICNYCMPLYTMYDGDITFTVTSEGYKIDKSKN